MTILCLIGWIGQAKAAIEPFISRDFSSLLEMPGWNRELLLMHFKLYQGYVKNTNVLLEELSQLRDKGLTKSYEFGALKRRLGWEFDGMRLHELYFENMGTFQAVIDKDFLECLKRDFGSFEAWKQDFISTGLIRGIGWVVLYQEEVTGRLVNAWINEHDVGHLVQGNVLIVMDVFEHAYITQFALDREKYIELFFQSLNWQVVNERAKKLTRNS